VRENDCTAGKIGVLAVVKRFSKLIIAKAGMAWCQVDVCC